MLRAFGTTSGRLALRPSSSSHGLPSLCLAEPSINLNNKSLYSSNESSISRIDGVLRRAFSEQGLWITHFPFSSPCPSFLLFRSNFTILLHFYFISLDSRTLMRLRWLPLFVISPRAFRPLSDFFSSSPLRRRQRDQPFAKFREIWS